MLPVLPTAIFVAVLFGWFGSDPRDYTFHGTWIPKRTILGYLIIRALVPGLSGVLGWWLTSLLREEVIPGPELVTALVSASIGYSLLRTPLQLFPVDGSEEAGSLLHRAARRTFDWLNVASAKTINQHVRSIDNQDLCDQVLLIFERDLAPEMVPRAANRSRKNLKVLTDSCRAKDATSCARLRGYYGSIIQKQGPANLKLDIPHMP